MKVKLSQRVQMVHESVTLKMNALAQDLIQQGQDLVNLTAGEPDFPVHELVKQAVIQAVHDNKSKYTLAVGVLELREAVARKTNLQQTSLAIPWTAKDVIITNGGKQALFNSFLAVLNPGDQVLIPSPYWTSYPEMVKLAGGEPVIVRTKSEFGFKLTPEQLSEAFLAFPRARVLVLNSPNNPTGAVYSKHEYQNLARILQTQAPADFLVISDEIYDGIVFKPFQFCSFLQAVPEWVNQTITINGLSKSAAMTGWRVGWSVAPLALTQAMAKIQGQSTSGINALAQAAAIKALSLPECEFIPQLESYQRRAELSAKILSEAKGLTLIRPQGAFYHFINCQAYLLPQETISEFCERMLKDALVALVPGDAFGEKTYARLSITVPEDQLAKACSRLVTVLKRKAA
ncbi:MAG: pyridoxal phosphate-dependent aminotransferase [Bdellovibrionales bacterium]|nr:pyridoxal phosphate-dependent aminotransferase [Bdellovibrionales bacterium]